MADQKTQEEIIEEMDPALLKTALKNVKEDMFREIRKEYNKATDSEGQQGAAPNSSLIDNGDHVSAGVDYGFREACTNEDQQAVEATDNDYSFVNSHQTTIDFLNNENAKLLANVHRLEDELIRQNDSEQLQELKCKLADLEKTNQELKQRDVGGVNLESFHVIQDELISLKKTKNLLKHDLKEKTNECDNNTRIMWQLHWSKLCLEHCLAVKEQEIQRLKEIIFIILCLQLYQNELLVTREDTIQLLKEGNNYSCTPQSKLYLNECLAAKEQENQHLKESKLCLEHCLAVKEQEIQRLKEELKEKDS